MILVTGAAGFIGSSLVDKLLLNNNEVIGIDNFSNNYDKNIKLKNIEKAKTNKLYTFKNNDIRDFTQLEATFAKYKIDLIVHLAARPGVRASFENPNEYYETNVVGTGNILECAKKYKVKNVIMASSSSVYGDDNFSNVSEDKITNKQISIYACTKKMNEIVAYNYYKNFNISIVLLRFFTVYGPRQRPDLAISLFSKNINENKKINIHGDGSTFRDYTYITDTVSGIVKSIDYIKTHDLVYEIFNIGSGNKITLNDMIDNLERELEKKAIRNYVEIPKGDVKATLSNCNKAIKFLGFKSEIDFNKGIELFAKYMSKK